LAGPGKNVARWKFGHLARLNFLNSPGNFRSPSQFYFIAREIRHALQQAFGQPDTFGWRPLQDFILNCDMGRRHVLNVARPSGDCKAKIRAIHNFFPVSRS
jgi:hypothetical protein